MRVVMVSHAFPPYSTGGVELTTAYNALALAERGHDVRVFYRVGQPERPEYEVSDGEWEGLPVTYINNTFANVDGFEMTYRNEAIETAFARYLERTNPDVVHFQHLTCLSTGLVEVARAQGARTVLALHDYWMACQRGQMLQPDLTLCAEPEAGTCARCLAQYILPWAAGAASALQGGEGSLLGRLVSRVPPALARRAAGLAGRLSFKALPRRDRRRAVDLVRARTRHVHEVMRQADALLTPSAFHRSQFVRFGVDPQHIAVQNTGLRTDLYAGAQPVPSESVRFCFIGTVMPPKGVHLLIEAFDALGDPRTTLDIHGEAVPYAAWPGYYQGLVAKAGPRIRFHGAYVNSQVGGILARADVVVVPAIWYESFSMVIHEAFLARVPVIAARLGAMAEFVKHEANGLLFEPRSASDLRIQMRRLSDEPDLRRRLSASPGPVKTIEQQAKELEEIYLHLGEGT